MRGGCRRLGLRETARAAAVLTIQTTEGDVTKPLGLSVAKRVGRNKGAGCYSGLSLFVQPEPSVLFLITHNGVVHMSKKQKKEVPLIFV